jgi:D-arabinose 1-dehydrogenase-like Zn-dependent alcohol dehydrogenase
LLALFFSFQVSNHDYPKLRRTPIIRSCLRRLHHFRDYNCVLARVGLKFAKKKEDIDHQPASQLLSENPLYAKSTNWVSKSDRSASIVFNTMMEFIGGFMATTEAAATMKVAQVPSPGADFQIVERQIPEPGAGHVRIKVQACGVCHSDVLTKEGAWPGIQYPRAPGHEVAGIIDVLGAGVSEWKKGQRVGVGWHGGHDGTCLSCRRGDFGNCQNMKIPGISYDGGYQQYMVAPVEALVSMPETLSDVEAAPLLCAGITTFNALRHSGALPSDLVAVQGIGGLGHLGIQFASKFGYNVAAIGRGSENAALAKKLGANVYIDSKATNAAEELQKLGGAKVILATAPSSKAMSELINGLGPNGKLIVIGATFDPIEVTPIQLITGSRTIQGWASGTPTDSEDTLRFAELTGVRPMIETYPLERAAEAYARMMSGNAQFRVVLTM